MKPLLAIVDLRGFPQPIERDVHAVTVALLTGRLEVFDRRLDLLAVGGRGQLVLKRLDLLDKRIKLATGRLETTDEGYCLAVSFPSGEERRTPLRPELVERATAADITLPEAIDDLLAAILPLAWYADPDDPVGGILFWPPDLWRLQDHDDLGPWVDLAAGLIGAEPPTETDETVRMGPSIEQQLVPNAAAAGD